MKFYNAFVEAKHTSTQMKTGTYPLLWVLLWQWWHQSNPCQSSFLPCSVADIQISFLEKTSPQRSISDKATRITIIHGSEYILSTLIKNVSVVLMPHLKPIPWCMMTELRNVTISHRITSRRFQVMGFCRLPKTPNNKTPSDTKNACNPCIYVPSGRERILSLKDFSKYPTDYPRHRRKLWLQKEARHTGNNHYEKLNLEFMDIFVWIFVNKRIYA